MRHQESGVVYWYGWHNNEKRLKLYGRRFRVLVRGGPNSALVEFENHGREVISRNAIRSWNPDLRQRLRTAGTAGSEGF